MSDWPAPGQVGLVCPLSVFMSSYRTDSIFMISLLSGQNHVYCTATVIIRVCVNAQISIPIVTFCFCFARYPIIKRAHQPTPNAASRQSVHRSYGIYHFLNESAGDLVSNVRKSRPKVMKQRVSTEQ